MKIIIYICKYETNSKQRTHLKTIKLQKLIFTPLDDKRYILENGIDTIPYGHYSIKPQ